MTTPNTPARRYYGVVTLMDTYGGHYRTTVTDRDVRYPAMINTMSRRTLTFYARRVAGRRTA